MNSSGDGECAHRLLLDYRAGVLIPRRACGGWAPDAIPIRGESVSELYARIEAGFERHLAQAEARVAGTFASREVF